MSHKLCVLIIEDDQDLAHLESKIFENSGFESIVANTGSQGLEYLEKYDISAVLLDYQLPDMDGREIILQLGDRIADIPVILTTGHGDQELAVEMMKLGCADYIVKSTPDASVFNIVRRLQRSIDYFALLRERRVHHEKLAENERTYRAIFEELSDPALICSLTSKKRVIIELANNLFLRKTFKKYEEVHNKFLEELLPDAFESAASVIKHSDQNGKAPLQEVKLQLSKSAGKIWYHLRCTSLDQNHYLLVFKDIHRRKQTEKSLEDTRKLLESHMTESNSQMSEMTKLLQQEMSSRINEQRLRSIYEGSTVGIFRINSEKKSVLVNPALVEMVGAKSQEDFYDNCQRMKWFQQLFENDKVVNDLVSTGRCANHQISWDRLDGERIYVRISIRRVDDNPSGEEFYEGTVEDITHSTQIRNELLNRVELEKLAISISTRFMNLSGEFIEQAIRGSLKKLGEALQVDLSVLAIYTPGNNQIESTYFWKSKELADFAINNDYKDLDKKYPWFFNMIKSNELITLTRKTELPPSAWEEYQVAEKFNLNSMIVLPLTNRGNMFGHLGLFSRSEKSFWNQDKIGFLEIVGDIFVYAIDRMNAEENMRFNLSEKEVLLKEIHHRVKNNLQIITSLLNLQAGYIKEARYKEMIKESQNRVKSMALLHEKLYQSENLSKINFADYAKDITMNLLSSYRVDTNRIELHSNINKLFFNLDLAIPLGLICNELLSNSFKHAFPENGKGEIWMNMGKSGENKYYFTFRDNGIGLPAADTFNTVKTLGMQLISTLVAQIDATFEIHNEQGFEFKIQFSECSNKNRKKANRVAR
ncbi:response regulator [bacterium]|nr:response regulator [bacterium]